MRNTQRCLCEALSASQGTCPGEACAKQRALCNSDLTYYSLLITWRGDLTDHVLRTTRQGLFADYGIVPPLSSSTARCCGHKQTEPPGWEAQE